MKQQVAVKKAKVTVENANKPLVTGNVAIEDTGTYLTRIIEKRSEWEGNAYKTSNEALYEILGDCLRLYYYVSDTKSDESMKARMGLRDQIARIAKERSIHFTSDTHLATKIVRCVFDTDRKRASTYSIAVRAAVSKKIAAENLPSFIHDEGGIENIRLKQRDPDGSKARKAKEDLFTKITESGSLGEIIGVSVDSIGASAKKGELNVAIVEWQADGKFIVKWIGQSEAAMDSAFAAFRRSQKQDGSVVQNDGDVQGNLPANDPVFIKTAA